MNLVTGATGHLGNVLVRELVEKGKKVRALILPTEKSASIDGLNVEKVEGNVLDRSSLMAASTRSRLMPNSCTIRADGVFRSLNMARKMCSVEMNSSLRRLASPWASSRTVRMRGV